MKPIAGSRQSRNHRSGLHLFLGVLLASTLACATPFTRPNAMNVESYNALDHSFTVMVPKDWKKEEHAHPYGDLTQISGARLTGPDNPAGVPVTISILHYSGTHLFKTPEEFIQNQLNSIVRIDYDQEAAVTAIKLAGRPGKSFRIKTFELVYFPQQGLPPMQEGTVYEIVPPHKQVDMLEQYLVSPAREGYFVLSYRAPMSLVEDFQKTFEQVVRTFQPHLP
jgi:hypothetical protein